MMPKHYIDKKTLKNAGSRFQEQNQQTRSFSSASAVTLVVVYSSLIPSKIKKITVTEGTQQAATNIHKQYKCSNKTIIHFNITNIKDHRCPHMKWQEFCSFRAQLG